MAIAVPAEVQKYLGEATMLYAYRDFQQAVVMLLEVVRLCPRLPHPYKTLGLIYEEEGHKKKALQLYLMAANLSKHDASHWSDLADLALEVRPLRERSQAGACAHGGARPHPLSPAACLPAQVGELEQALFCLGKVLSLAPTDVDALWQQARLHSRLGQHKKAKRSSWELGAGALL